MGPTASGKTGLAIQLTRRLPCEIISVDSAMVYRQMDIGTAKPEPEELEEAPHRLIDIRDPAESYSAAEFRREALGHIEAIHRNGNIPLLVGGTMLYFKALREGLSRLPAADPVLREQLNAEGVRLGWPALHARLESVDSESAARIHPNDPQRIQRALEVFELTGVPLSQLRNASQPQTFDYPLCQMALTTVHRGVLHRRIEERFDRMLERGFIEEVQRLRDRGDLTLDKPALRAVGYRQVWEHIAGNSDYDEMRYRGVVATRQLVKRQFTWLRGTSDLVFFECLEENPLDKVLKTLETRLTLDW